MEGTMKELDKLSKQRESDLQKAKKDGKSIIQYTGNFIPEEMIKAAGAEPYLMCRGGESEPIDASLEDIHRFINPLVSSMVGFYELGLDPVTPISDLIVMQQTDNHIARISELFEFKKLPVWKIGVPPDWKKKIAFNYYIKSLEKFKVKLEDMTGKPINNEIFKNELEKTNRLHEALRRIDSLRKRQNPPIGLTEFAKLNHYSFMVDKDIMIEELNELYDKLKDAPGKFHDNDPRILFCGRALAIGDYTIPRLFGESGGIIVSDFMDEGMRPYRNDYTINGEPLISFAKTSYLERHPISVFQPAWEDRFEYMKDLIKEYDVDGVVWYQLSFDEIYDMEYTVLVKLLGELNIPIIKIESSYEYSKETMVPLNTRVESFIELLKKGK